MSPEHNSMPLRNGRISSVVERFPSASYGRVFQAVLEAVLLGGSGIYLGGQAGSARTKFLNKLLAAVPVDRLVVVRFGAHEPPAAFAHLIESLKQDGAWHAPRALIVIDDADVLRRDTLDVLDQTAPGLLDDEAGPHLLLVGHASFDNRLAVTRRNNLAAYLRTRLALDPVLTPHAEAPSAHATFGTGLDTPARLTRAKAVGRRTARKRVLVGAVGCLGVITAIGTAWSVMPPLSVAPDRQPSPAPADGLPDATPGPPAVENALNEAPAQARAASSAGLLLLAGQGDTLAKLYRSLYFGVTAPPFAEIVAANPGPVRPGRRLLFPTPPGGWRNSGE